MKTYNVLFICTGNSARSIIAESILNQEGGGRFHACSAGSAPRGEVHPLALRVLASEGYPVAGLHSKGWEVFSGSSAPALDFIFTVCSDAAGETCPVWPGQPVTAHWGIPDPAAANGTALERETAFVTAFRFLRNRILAFTALPIESLDRLALTAHLKDIGRSDGSSAAVISET
jgi:arsenate reductase